MKISLAEFLSDPESFLELMIPGSRIEIDDHVVLIHPEDLRYLEKCAELVDSLPISIEDDEL